MFAGQEEELRLTGAGALPPVAYSLLLVAGPTRPSTAMAVAAWYSRTAYSVAEPNWPSTTRPAPCALSRFCNSVTQPLVWP